MVGTIIPMVHRDKSKVGYVIYVSCCAGSAGLLGAGVALAGGFMGRLYDFSEFEARLVISLIAVAYGLNALHLIKVPTPQKRDQVPRTWSTGVSGKLGCALYGFGVGMPLLTPAGRGSVYPLIAWGLMSSHTPLSVAFVFAAYGLGKAMPVLLVTASHVAHDSWFGFTTWLADVRPFADVMEGAGLVGLGGAVLCRLMTL